MSQDLPFLLRQQARDRVEEHEAEHQPDAGDDPETGKDDAAEDKPAEEEDRLEPTADQIDQERRRLRQAAEMAEKAYRLADDEEVPEAPGD